MPVRSATLIQISGTSTPSRSRHAISTARRPTHSADAQSARLRSGPAARRSRAKREPPEDGGERRRAPAPGVLGLEDRVEILRGQCLAQLLQGARLELPHALARQAERLADLLERVLLLAAEAVAEPQDQLLARGERADQGSDSRAHPLAVEPVVGRGGG